MKPATARRKRAGQRQGEMRVSHFFAFVVVNYFSWFGVLAFFEWLQPSPPTARLPPGMLAAVFPLFTAIAHTVTRFFVPPAREWPFTVLSAAAGAVVGSSCFGWTQALNIRPTGSGPTMLLLLLIAHQPLATWLVSRLPSLRRRN